MVLDANGRFLDGQPFGYNTKSERIHFQDVPGTQDHFKIINDTLLALSTQYNNTCTSTTVLIVHVLCNCTVVQLCIKSKEKSCIGAVNLHKEDHSNGGIKPESKDN